MHCHIVTDLPQNGLRIAARRAGHHPSGLHSFASYLRRQYTLVHLGLPTFLHRNTGIRSPTFHAPRHAL